MTIGDILEYLVTTRLNESRHLVHLVRAVVHILADQNGNNIV
jgi:hypothetical protein